MSRETNDKLNYLNAYVLIALVCFAILVGIISIVHNNEIDSSLPLDRLITVREGVPEVVGSLRFVYYHDDITIFNMHNDMLYTTLQYPIQTGMIIGIRLDNVSIRFVVYAHMEGYWVMLKRID